MQLALALSLSMLPARGKRDLCQGLHTSRAGAAVHSSAAVLPSAAGSSSTARFAAAVTEGEGRERCSICLDDDLPSDVEGEPRQKMGWGVAPCCGHVFHYSCLGHWLRMAIAGDSLVDSSCGPVPMALKCLTCKGQLSKCSSRMLGKRASNES